MKRYQNRENTQFERKIFVKHILTIDAISRIICKKKSAHKIVNMWGSENLSNDNEKCNDRQNRENFLYKFNIFNEFLSLWIESSSRSQKIRQRKNQKDKKYLKQFPKIRQMTMKKFVKSLFTQFHEFFGL